MNWVDFLVMNLSEESYHLGIQLKQLISTAKSVEDANIVAFAAALSTGQTALASEITSNGVLLGNPHREIIIKSVQEELINTVKHEFFSVVRSFKAYTPSVLDGLTDPEEIRISLLSIFTAGLVISRYGVDDTIATLINSHNYDDAVLHQLASIAANVAAIKAAI